MTPSDYFCSITLMISKPFFYNNLHFSLFGNVAQRKYICNATPLQKPAIKSANWKWKLFASLDISKRNINCSSTIFRYLTFFSDRNHKQRVLQLVYGYSKLNNCQLGNNLRDEVFLSSGNAMRVNWHCQT